MTSGDANVVSTKETNNLHGSFVFKRLDKALPFTCGRCHTDKTAKITVEWTKTSGERVEVCNGCYGWLTANPGADPTVEPRVPKADVFLFHKDNLGYWDDVLGPLTKQAALDKARELIASHPQNTYGIGRKMPNGDPVGVKAVAE